jgi:hypothetical protein
MIGKNVGSSQIRKRPGDAPRQHDKSIADHDDEAGAIATLVNRDWDDAYAYTSPEYYDYGAWSASGHYAADQPQWRTRDFVFQISCVPGPMRFSEQLMYKQQFAEPVDMQGQALLHEFFLSFKQSVYPIQLCMEDHDSDASWFNWLLSDPAYLNVTLLIVSMLKDILASPACRGIKQDKLHGLISPRPWAYLRRSLQLLQGRIDDADRQLEDATTAIVIVLCLTAEMLGDEAAFQMHFEGLARIVRLRGGVDSFRSNCKMQVKICR